MGAKELDSGAKSIPQAQRRDKSRLCLSLSYAFWYETEAELPVSLEEVGYSCCQSGCVRFGETSPGRKTGQRAPYGLAHLVEHPGD